MQDCNTGELITFLSFSPSPSSPFPAAHRFEQDASQRRGIPMEPIADTATPCLDHQVSTPAIGSIGGLSPVPPLLGLGLVPL